MKYSGASANVQWRAIAVDHLRQHPLFVPLPGMDMLPDIAPCDASVFRQRTPQWTALHAGRLTTSVLASILGFYEHEIAKRLAVPNSLQDHAKAVEAWQQLKTKPRNDISKLCMPGTPLREGISPLQASDLWKHDKVRFPYDYQPSEPLPDLPEPIRNPLQAKLCWGETQEPTGILCAVNYLAATDPQLRVHEAGMATFEKVLAEPESCSDLERAIQQLQDARKLPPLGASPDGLIVSPTGKVTCVLEVKCTSPFTLNHAAPYGMRVSSPAHIPPTFPAWHIPQLQLEMLCCGASCRSALVVLLDYNRARIFRIDRDDQVGRHCLSLLHTNNWSECSS